MSPESIAERTRLILAAERTRSQANFKMLQGITEAEFRSQNWQVDVSFDERNGLICVWVRSRSHSQMMGNAEFPCDAPFTSKDEMQSAISDKEADPSVSFLTVEVMRAVYNTVFEDDETNEEWGETVVRRRQIIEREQIVAEAARNGSPTLAEGAL